MRNCWMGRTTWLSMLSRPRKLPRFSRTPTTSSQRGPILIFLPSGDSLMKRLVETSLPMTQTGRPPPVSLAVKKRPWSTPIPAVWRNCSVVPMIWTPAGAAVLVTDGTSHVNDRSDGAGQGHLPFHGLDLIARDDAPFVFFEPFVLAVDEPVHAIGKEHVGAHGGNALVKGAVQAVNGRAHQSHADDADDDAQGGQARAHFVGADGVPGDEQALFEFEEKIHAPAPGFWTASSLAIRPSRMRMMRRAWRATSSSWVTTKMVLPLSESTRARP